MKQNLWDVKIKILLDRFLLISSIFFIYSVITLKLLKYYWLLNKRDFNIQNAQNAFFYTI